MPLIGALDQGTTSTRFLVYDEELHIVAGHQVEHRQITPQAGWLEHDPEELYRNALLCMEEVVKTLGDRSSEIQAVGMTNQRETTVVWDKVTGKPLYNAIVWSDLRTTSTVEALAAAWGSKDALQSQSGLPLSTYFSALKLRWILHNVPDVQHAVEQDRCLFGTIDSWLIYRLSGQQTHATDITNASRTMLMDITTGQWSPKACDMFGIPTSILPEVRSNCEKYCNIADGPLKGVPITSSIGDQQAATVGQGCFTPGQAKNTYGSGCFVLKNTGSAPVHSQHGLLTTVCYHIKGQDPIYALEGSIANGGTVVQWLKNSLGLITSPAECQELAASVPDTGGVIFVPALSGLYAPYWRDDARGTLLGMTQFTTRAHICRAALEGICFLTREVLEAMELDSGYSLSQLAVDGGMSRNDLMMQMQADILGTSVVRAANTESTSMGCTMLAGLAVGVWKDMDELRGLVAGVGLGQKWHPKWSGQQRNATFGVWKRAVENSFTRELYAPPSPGTGSNTSSAHNAQMTERGPLLQGPHCHCSCHHIRHKIPLPASPLTNTLATASASCVIA